MCCWHLFCLFFLFPGAAAPASCCVSHSVACDLPCPVLLLVPAPGITAVRQLSPGEGSILSVCHWGAHPSLLLYASQRGGVHCVDLRCAADAWHVPPAPSLGELLWPALCAFAMIAWCQLDAATAPIFLLVLLLLPGDVPTQAWRSSWWLTPLGSTGWPRAPAGAGSASGMLASCCV